jgi:AtzH-like
MSSQEGELDEDLRAAFDRYEHALMDGDTAVQAGSFWSDPSVVRVDQDGPVIGPERLAEFRARRPTPGPRRLRGLHVVHSPGDTVVTVSVNERLGPDGQVAGLGTQTQVWARTADGWRVIAACVSPMTPPPATGA